MNEHPEYKYHDIQQAFFAWMKPNCAYEWLTDSDVDIEAIFSRQPREYSKSFYKYISSSKDANDLFTIQTVEPIRYAIQSVKDRAKIDYPPPYLAPIQEEYSWIPYSPLEYPALSHEFLGCQPNYDGFRAFANQFGSLNGNLWVRRSVDGAVIGGADSFMLWFGEWQDMSWTEQVWRWQERANESDLKALKKVIRWGDNRLEYVLADTEVLNHYPSASHLINAIEDGKVKKSFARGVLASGANDPIFTKMKRGDLILPARYLVFTIIDQKLAYHGIHLRSMLFEPNKLDPYIMPSTLVGAIWMQFFFLVVGEKKLKRCPHCGKWEDVTDRRPDWQAHEDCANAARVRKHYLKKKQAKATATKGRSKK